MVRLLRWGSFVVIFLVIIGAALTYPLLRARFITPMQAAPIANLPTLATVPATQTALGQTARDATTTPRPTRPAPSTRPAVVIAAPSPTLAPPTIDTPAPVPENVSVIDAQVDAPIVVATTSLLPNAVTPVVLGPSTDGVETPTPSAVATQPVLVENSREFVDTSVLSGGATAAAPVATATTASVTPTVSAANVTPIVVVPIDVAPNTSAPGAAITPIVPTTITVANDVATPLPTSTPQPSGPTANVASALYVSPDLAAPTVVQVIPGEQLIVVGLYTEGNWYLLASGLWIPGNAVSNAPFAMPLVFPTMTPPPSPTPTSTFTPLPTATAEGTATPTPTATSLDAPVCDCSGDSLDCLGNIFANRGDAQRCFEYCFRETGLDIHLLDPNLNGMACENLP